MKKIPGYAIVLFALWGLSFFLAWPDLKVGMVLVVCCNLLIILFNYIGMSIETSNETWRRFETWWLGT